MGVAVPADAQPGKPVRYVPVGSRPYVLRRDWVPTTTGITAGGAITAYWAAVAPTEAFAIFALIAAAILVGTVRDLVRSADRTGVQFAIDEHGIYFGRPPREHIPWPMIAEVTLTETRSGRATHRALSVRVAPPTDRPDTAAGRVRHAAFTPDHTAIRHALARHAPPHVQITDT